MESLVSIGLSTAMTHHILLPAKPTLPLSSVLTLGTALGCATIAGVLFAFSSFVMAGLARLPAAQGIAAMQSINITAVRPAFMTVLFGTAGGCLALAVRSLRTWGARSSALMLAGSALYLIGTIGITIAYHVPRNDRLATLDPGGPGAAAVWNGYVRNWTLLNHVRAGAALVAAVLLLLALLDTDPAQPGSPS